MHHIASIFLTPLLFLAGGNFAVAKNQQSSASLGDLYALVVNQEFSTTMEAQWTWANCLYLNPSSNCTEYTDKSGLDRQGSKNAKVLETPCEALFQSSRVFHLRSSASICGSNNYFLVANHQPPSASLGDLCALAVNSSSIRRTTPDGKTIDLTYNPDGHGLTKFITQNALTQRLVHYLTDANNPTGYAQVIEEKHPLEVAGSQLKKVNLYGHDLVATESRSVGVSPSSSSPLPTPTSLLFYSYDGLGSVRSISNATGDLQETYDYDAYGTLIGLNKRNPTTGVLESSLITDHSALFTQSDYLYTGEQYDSDLGMYFLRARYLNTNTGRFHTQDTYEGRNGEPLSLHKYLYANGNPASYTDPSGRMSLGEVTLVNGLIGGLASASFNLFQGFASGDIFNKEGKQIAKELGFSFVEGAALGVVGGGVSSTVSRWFAAKVLNIFVRSAIAGAAGASAGEAAKQLWDFVVNRKEVSWLNLRSSGKSLVTASFGGLIAGGFLAKVKITRPTTFQVQRRSLEEGLYPIDFGRFFAYKQSYSISGVVGSVFGGALEKYISNLDLIGND